MTVLRVARWNKSISPVRRNAGDWLRVIWIKCSPCKWTKKKRRSSFCNKQYEKKQYEKNYSFHKVVTITVATFFFLTLIRQIK